MNIETLTLTVDLKPENRVYPVTIELEPMGHFQNHVMSRWRYVNKDGETIFYERSIEEAAKHLIKRYVGGLGEVLDSKREWGKRYVTFTFELYMERQTFLGLSSGKS